MPILEYIYPYNIKLTSRNCKPLRKGFRIATGCTRDTNTQRLHDKSSVLSMGTHFKLHATELKQMTQTQTHPLHYFNAHLDPQINKITYKCKKIYRILLGAGATKILITPVPALVHTI